MTKSYQKLVADILPQIKELMPWDLEEMLEDPSLKDQVLIVDIRETDEFASGTIQNALHVPRGILESSCDWGYSDTLPRLVQARQQPVVLACRSGNRSALAAFTLQLMGYQQVYSLKTGIRGWNDYELPLYDLQGQQVDIDQAEIALSPPVIPEQMPPS